MGLPKISENGAVSLGTYVTNTSAYLQTNTNHPLRFATKQRQTPSFTLATNGFVGIGKPGPELFRCPFSNVLGGQKFHSGVRNPASAIAPHYGLGVQSSRFQLFAPTASGQTSCFGTGSSGDFTEKRPGFTGDGKSGASVTVSPVFGWDLSWIKKTGGSQCRFRVEYQRGCHRNQLPGAWDSNSYYNNGPQSHHRRVRRD